MKCPSCGLEVASKAWVCEICFSVLDPGLLRSGNQEGTLDEDPSQTAEGPPHISADEIDEIGSEDFNEIRTCPIPIDFIAPKTVEISFQLPAKHQPATFEPQHQPGVNEGIFLPFEDRPDQQTRDIPLNYPELQDLVQLAMEEVDRFGQCGDGDPVHNGHLDPPPNHAAMRIAPYSDELGGLDITLSEPLNDMFDNDTVDGLISSFEPHETVEGVEMKGSSYQTGNYAPLASQPDSENTPQHGSWESADNLVINIPPADTAHESPSPAMINDHPPLPPSATSSFETTGNNSSFEAIGNNDSIPEEYSDRLLLEAYPTRNGAHAVSSDYDGDLADYERNIVAYEKDITDHIDLRNTTNPSFTSNEPHELDTKALDVDPIDVLSTSPDAILLSEEENTLGATTPTVGTRNTTTPSPKNLPSAVEASDGIQSEANLRKHSHIKPIQKKRPEGRNSEDDLSHSDLGRSHISGGTSNYESVITEPSVPSVSIELAKAAQFYRKAQKDQREGRTSSALANIRLALTFNPKNTQYAEALQSMSQNPPLSASKTSVSTARELYQKATTAQDQGEYDAATELLEQALTLYRQPALLNRLAVIFATHHHDFNRAQSLLEEAISRAPGKDVYVRNLDKVLSMAASANGQEVSQPKVNLWSLLGIQR